MSNLAVDRRQYERYQVDGGSLFSDKENLVGYGSVVDISKGGVRCVSLSHVNCLICQIDGIELYIPSLNLDVKGLCGRMIQCYQVPIDSSKSESTYYCGFSLEFTSRCRPMMAELRGGYGE